MATQVDELESAFRALERLGTKNIPNNQDNDDTVEAVLALAVIGRHFIRSVSRIADALEAQNVRNTEHNARIEAILQQPDASQQ